MVNKARYWWGVFYPENMLENWKDEIADRLEVPFAYCVHDKDLLADGDETRKVHVHIMVAFSNTTTRNSVKELFSRLNANGKIACPEPQNIIHVRRAYDYLIHDTDECRKKNKFQYPKSSRITGNNFDIGNFEQLGTAERADMAKELCDLIVEKGFTNFIDFYDYAMKNFDSAYFEVIKSYSGLFERLVKGNYLKRV